MFLVVGGVIYYIRPAPTCSDKILNQSEEGVDCGGECDACIGSPSQPVIFWTRAFELVPGFYEAAALIENPNINVGASEVSYTIRLFAGSAQIAKKKGKTFLNPREKFLVYENDIAVGERTPTRATIEFDEIKWKAFKDQRPNV